MADPFSVAGTAVGIISLGLQTCQILYKYCSDFKSFPRDVEATQRQIRGLEGILQGLHEVKEQLEIDNHTPSSQLHMALKDCKETLHELMRMVEKRNPASKSEGVQTQLRAVKERVLWPYRKEDLKEVQSSLTRFQENLALALQCAGLDGTLRRLRDLHSEFIIQQQQAIRVEQALNQNTEVLQMIRRDVASQGPDLSKIYNEIMSLRAQLSEDRVSVEVGRYQLVDSDSSSQQLTPTSSSTIYAFPHEENLGRTSRLPIQSCTVQTERFYSCRCRSKRKRKVEPRRWYMIQTDEAYDHHRDCPRFTHGDYTKSVAFQVSMYNSLLKFCVQIGWQSSRKGGWNSPAPVLRYRAVAPQDSPVFKLLDCRLELFQYGNLFEEISSSMAIILPTIAPKLQQEFGKGACPTDLDLNGDGILFAVLRLIEKAIDLMDSRAKFMSDVSKVIDVCFDAGVPFNDEDAWRRTPLEYWMLKLPHRTHSMHEWKIRYDHVLFLLIQRTESWSSIPISLSRLSRSSYQTFFDNVSALLQLESFSNTFTEDDSRREVILRRSEFDFATGLRASGVDAWVSLFAKYDSVYALASWPGGLSTVLSDPNVILSQDLLKKLLNAAITIENVESIEVLLNYEVLITRETWYYITERLFLFESHYKQANSSLTKIFRQIAGHLYQDHNAGSDDQISTRSFEGVNTTDQTSSLYHSIYLTPLQLECAWQAGHRGVESIGRIGNSRRANKTGISTPLWAQAISWLLHGRSNPNMIASFGWLMRHGADPFWVHPIHLTTPAHVLTRELVGEDIFGTTSKSEYRKDIFMLLSSKVSDNCRCYCSQDGCSAIGCAIGTPFGRPWRYLSITGLREHQAYFFSLVDNNHNDSWMASAILRVLTFKNLSLTHTCCYRFQDELLGDFTRPTSEEAEEIHNFERDDVEVLEKIVTELEGKWAEYKKPFVTFMNRVWRPRMRKMHRDREVDKATYRAELVQVGIELAESDGETDLETDSDGESDASWPDDYEDTGSEGWYTTDEEDGADEVEDDGEGSS